MADDQSQRPAEPLPTVEPRTLIRNLQGAERVATTSVDAEANRLRAAAEIAAIFELNENRTFQWFIREFIDKPYQEAFRKLRLPNARMEGESLEGVQMTYSAMREVKVGMLEREIAHRELLNPNDEEIPRLRQKLSLL
jgi:hypothetical protein